MGVRPRPTNREAAGEGTRVKRKGLLCKNNGDWKTMGIEKEAVKTCLHATSDIVPVCFDRNHNRGLQVRVWGVRLDRVGAVLGRTIRHAGWSEAALTQTR